MQWAMHWPTDPMSPCSRFAGGGNLFKPTVKILNFGTPQTIAIIVLKIEKFEVTLH